MTVAKSRLGEASVVAIFSHLENSIKADVDRGKTQVPGAVVHRSTPRVMNRIKVACDFKGAMEQVFQLNMEIRRKITNMRVFIID